MPAPRPSSVLQLLLLPAAAMLCIGTEASAAAVSTGALGLGIILGEPSGISLRYGLAPRRTLDAALAFSIGNGFEATADYTWTFPGAFSGPSSFARNLTPYVGVGGALLAYISDGRRGSRLLYASETGIAAGLRIPLGVEWTPEGTPLGIFAELVPGIGIIPGTTPFFEGGAGIRYYF